MKKNSSTKTESCQVLRQVLPYAMVFIFIGISCCLLAYFTRDEPAPRPSFMTSTQNDYIRGAISAIVTMGLGLLILIKTFKPVLLKGRLRVGLKVSAVLVVIVAGFVYFYSARGLTRRHYLNFHDLYHYYLGAKFFPETSYNDFYACHLQADQSRSHPRHKDKDKVRDLSNYKILEAKEIREKADCSRFSKERWEQFRADTRFFDKYSGKKVMRDHGYNGTPFHAFFASKIAGLVSANYKNLVLISFVDIMALCILFAVLVWGVGWKLSFCFSTFLFVNFADFYFHVSFGRYWWLMTLGIGLAFLYRKKYAPSAVFLVASAMLNVFPLLFFAGIGLKIVFSLVTRRHLESCYKTFVVWAFMASVVFGGISMMHDRPLERYQVFFNNMGMHSSLLTSSRIGFQYNTMFKGEVTEDSPNYSYKQKRQDLKDIAVPYGILVGLILLFGAAIIVRLDDFRATILGGFLLFFMLFSTVAYYYAVASVLVLLWTKNIQSKRGLGFVALLFGLMGLVYVFWWQSGYRAFLNNTVLTAMFTIYLAVTMIYLAFETQLLGSSSWLYGKMNKHFRRQ
jgi:hypothetical protein